MKILKFGEWLNIWFNTYKKPRLSFNGFAPIKSCIANHVDSELKQKELSKLTVLDIDMCISSLKPSRTQKLLYDTLKACLRKAFALNLIKKDISNFIEPVRYKLKQGVELSKLELVNFLNRIKGHKTEHYFLFCLVSGCRRSEALRVLWSDFDYKSKLLYIRGTKTVSSERFIPLTDDLVELVSKISKTDNHLFSFNADYVTKTFKKFCPEHKLHDLRHTFATLLAENGVHPSVCQKLLGHSKIDTTMRIYTHVRNDYIMTEMQKVNFLLSEENDKTKST